MVLQRVRDAGFQIRDSVIECLGTGAASADILGNDVALQETVLRVAVESDSPQAVECFSGELMPFVTAGPQGTTGYAEGRPRVHLVLRYWPCLIPRSAIAPHVEMLVSTESTSMLGLLIEKHKMPVFKEVAPTRPQRPAATSRKPSRLYDIACARSGDKGSAANIGVVGRNDAAWKFLHAWLTADRVAKYFAPMQPDAVERYELPNLGALNFILRGVLKRNLRTDAQGKALGQILLEMPLPENLEAVS
jgi:hypothetical protein